MELGNQLSSKFYEKNLNLKKAKSQNTRISESDTSLSTPSTISTNILKKLPSNISAHVTPTATILNPVNSVPEKSQTKNSWKWMHNDSPPEEVNDNEKPIQWVNLRRLWGESRSRESTNIM